MPCALPGDRRVRGDVTSWRHITDVPLGNNASLRTRRATHSLDPRARSGHGACERSARRPPVETKGRWLGEIAGSTPVPDADDVLIVPPGLQVAPSTITRLRHALAAEGPDVVGVVAATADLASGASDVTAAEHAGAGRTGDAGRCRPPRRSDRGRGRRTGAPGAPPRPARRSHPVRGRPHVGRRARGRSGRRRDRPRAAAPTSTTPTPRACPRSAGARSWCSWPPTPIPLAPRSPTASSTSWSASTSRPASPSTPARPAPTGPNRACPPRRRSGRSRRPHRRPRCDGHRPRRAVERRPAPHGGDRARRGRRPHRADRVDHRPRRRSPTAPASAAGSSPPRWRRSSTGSAPAPSPARPARRAPDRTNRMGRRRPRP